MGRAVMVGRGRTGAGVLVLSILIILTAEDCRAQKGWCLSAAVTCNRWRVAAGTRGHVGVKFDHGRLGVPSEERGVLLLCAALKRTLHGPVYVEFRLVYTACRRPSCRIRCGKTRRTGSVKPKEQYLNSTVAFNELLTDKGSSFCPLCVSK